MKKNNINQVTLKVVANQNNPNGDIYLTDFLEKMERMKLVQDGTIQIFVGK